MTGSPKWKLALSDWKDIGIRAVKTAIEVFIAFVGADVLGWTDMASTKQAGITALAAGVTVVVNAIYAWATDTTEG